MSDFLSNLFTGIIVVVVVGVGLALLPASILPIVAGVLLAFGVSYALYWLAREISNTRAYRLSLVPDPNRDDRG